MPTHKTRYRTGKSSSQPLTLNCKVSSQGSLSKVLCAGIMAVCAPSLVLAQSSSSAAVSGQSQTSASSSGNILSKLNYSVSQQFMGDTSPRAVNEQDQVLPDGSPNVRFDRDAGMFDSITSLGASYKMSSGSTLGLVQRIGYTYNRRADRQLQASLSAIRIHYGLPIRALGADGTLTLRVAPAHTHYLYHDMNFLGTVALMPSLTWALTPTVSVSYAGYLGANFYNGKQREANNYHRLTASDTRDAAFTAAKVKTSEKAGVKVSELSEKQLRAAEIAGSVAGVAALNKRFAPTAQERNFYVLTNNFAVSYQISPKIKVGQGLGYGIISKEYNNPKARSSLMHTAQSIYGEISTTMGIQVAKAVSVDLGVTQAHPFLEGSGDPVTSKLYFYRDGYSLYYPEQTLYSVTTAVRF